MQMPKQMDVIVIDAEPHSGKEYGEHNPTIGNTRRHMVVMSDSGYNEATGMVLAMPITTSPKYKNKPEYYPILIMGGEETGVKGYVVGWQLQNFDYRTRNGKVVNKITAKQYKELLSYVEDMLGIES